MYVYYGGVSLRLCCIMVSLGGHSICCLFYWPFDCESGGRVVVKSSHTLVYKWELDGLFQVHKAGDMNVWVCVCLIALSFLELYHWLVEKCRIRCGYLIPLTVLRWLRSDLVSCNMGLVVSAAGGESLLVGRASVLETLCHGVIPALALSADQITHFPGLSLTLIDLCCHLQWYEYSSLI